MFRDDAPSRLSLPQYWNPVAIRASAADSIPCDDLLADGRLQRVLPKWRSPLIPVHALYPTRKFLPARLRVFLEALQAWDSPFWTK